MNNTDRLPYIDLLTSLLLAALIALVLTLSNVSAGIIRGGGGDDEGSGIGGTGKRGPDGRPSGGEESGFGGTGFRPFLGFNVETGEILILDSAPLGAGAGQRSDTGASVPQIVTLSLTDFTPTLAPLPAPVPVPGADPLPPFNSSQAVSVTRAIQWELEATGWPLDFEPVQPWALNGAAPSSATAAESAVALAITGEPSTSGDWGVLADLGTESATEPDKTPERVTRTDRVQRPDLPPIQRARPVERISVLPPRVQPMRI